jgi:uncharacterized protein
MTGYIAIPLVAIAGAGLLLLGGWASRKSASHQTGNPAIRHHLLYQPLSAIIAIVTVLAVRLLVPRGTSFLRAGDLQAPVTGIQWMGITPSDTWMTIGLTTGAAITLVTAVVVWLQSGKPAGVGFKELPLAALIALPFAIVNSAVEEAIFRLAICNAMSTIAPMMTVAIISGVLFGVPHYFGNPGKVPGVLLAGFLGWLMCLSMLQTQGIAWAWGIHFVQDVVIIAILFAVSGHRQRELRAEAAEEV